MRGVVMGAAAGGGFVQWNSNVEACRRGRAGEAGVVARSLASLALSGDGERWFLINASPDLRQQIEARQILQPNRGLRSSPIEGVIITGTDVDAIAGLLHLRERQPFTIYASMRVLDVLAANPIFAVLAEDCVRREAVPLGRPFEPRHVDGTIAAFRDIPVKRKILIHINNSNPILVDGSTERGLLAKAGWEVAHDGMEVGP